VQPDPSSESFFASKSNVLILIGIGTILLIALAAIIAKVVWGVDSFAIVGAAIGGVTAHTTGGVYRNVQVDGPIRQMQAQASYGVPPPQVQQQQAGTYIPPAPPQQ